MGQGRRMGGFSPRDLAHPAPSGQEMDLESLEAANQSLQSDLKLAFKRIGDLQAAIEDEMESDSNEDLINR